MKESALLVIKGGIIGVANIIPGVSGGTLAVVLGVYDRLIEAISCFFARPDRRKEYLLFLTKIFCGAGIAIVLLANVMDFLLTYHPQLTMFAFMGLIIGGIPAIWRSHGDMKVRPWRVAAFLGGMILVIVPAFFGAGAEEAARDAAGGAAVDGRYRYAMLLLAGFLAGGGMIIPGISGSFILVLMGQYAVIIAAIKGLVPAPLILVAAGAALGIFFFSKGVEVCLEKAPSVTYYFIMGLVIASLCEIFPGIPGGMIAAVGAGAAFTGGVLAAYCMARRSPRK